MGYGNWLHGEAVAVGQCVGDDLSLANGEIYGSTMFRAVSVGAAFSSGQFTVLPRLGKI